MLLLPSVLPQQKELVQVLLDWPPPAWPSLREAAELEAFGAQLTVPPQRVAAKPRLAPQVVVEEARLPELVPRRAQSLLRFRPAR